MVVSGRRVRTRASTRHGLRHRTGLLLLSIVVMSACAWPRGVVLCQAEGGHLALELQVAGCCTARETDSGTAALSFSEDPQGQNCRDCKDTAGDEMAWARVPAPRAVAPVAVLPSAWCSDPVSPRPVLPASSGPSAPEKGALALLTGVVLQV